MKEVAKVLGYTESRISQIHNQAIMKLRAILKQEHTFTQGGDKHAHGPKHQDTHR